jgi:hypothetical protein
MTLTFHARTTAALTVAIALLAARAVAIGLPAAAASGAPSFQINDVSCVNASFCIAVGSSALRSAGLDGSSRTLIERWNGTKWSIVSSPGAKGAGLRGVTCRSTMFCIAVGLQTAVGPGSGKTLAIRWNGTTWTILPTPNPSDPSGSSFAALNDVSCSSTTNCKAMGLYTTGDGRAPTLAERWNGTKWWIDPSPNLSVGGTGQWLGVACPSSTMCIAVGQDGLDPVFGGPNMESARWNGTKWTLLEPSPPAKAYTVLSAVSCVSLTNCIAVGWSWTGSVFQPDPRNTLVEHWNGTKWTIIPSTVGGTTASQLNGISCKSASNCVAVGSYAVPGDPAGTQRTLVLRWNGTKWSMLAGPNPAGATGTVLASVSCISAANCAAVGRSTTSTFERPLDAGPYTTLIEKWNGTSWSIVASPRPPTPTPDLNVPAHSSPTTALSPAERAP